LKPFFETWYAPPSLVIVIDVTEAYHRKKLLARNLREEMNRENRGMALQLRLCFGLIFLCLLLAACGGEEEPAQKAGHWNDRESSFQDMLHKTKQTAVDFSGQDRRAPSPEFKKEKSEEEILHEPLREWILGVMGPETGELSSYGEKTLTAVTLAVEEVNHEGGVRGHTIELLHLDTLGGITGTLNAAHEMIEKHVMAIVGSPTGDVTFSATKPLNDSRTIFFSAGTRRRIGDTGIYHFRNTMDDDKAAGEVVQYCLEKKGYKDFALLTSMVNDFSVQLSASFKMPIMLQGGRISKDLFLWPKTTTYITKQESSVKAQIQKLKEGPMPDAFIFTGGLEKGIQVLQTLREEGVTIPFIGDEDLVEDRFLQKVGPAALGMLAYAGFDPGSSEPHVRKFVDAYKAKFGKKPDRIAALAYDAAKIILQGAEDAASLRSGFLRKAILNIRDFPGVTGLTSFSKVGEVLKRPTIFQVEKKKGKMEFVAVTKYR